MYIRLLKSYTRESGKKLPIGQIMNVLPAKAKKFIEEGVAEEYSGSRMKPAKAKTELFKPKKNNKKWQQQDQ